MKLKFLLLSSFLILIVSCQRRTEPYGGVKASQDAPKYEVGDDIAKPETH